MREAVDWYTNDELTASDRVISFRTGPFFSTISDILDASVRLPHASDFVMWPLFLAALLVVLELILSTDALARVDIWFALV